jgi:hypothetical protein
LSSVFSPVNDECEQQTAEIFAAELPGVAISRLHRIGRVGLLERENATIINACLRGLAARIIDALRGVLAQLTDVGMLRHGFPRPASVAVEIAGVRTNFRMPEVSSWGLGGGSLVQEGTEVSIGPDSVGYELTSRALVFGGDTVTATDVAVAGGRAVIGDPARVAGLGAASAAVLPRAAGHPYRSIEAGGSNSTVPLRVDAQLGIPVVDADGMGRAFTEIQMVTASLSGVSATPMALADEKGNTAIIDTVDNPWAERLSRSLTIDMGCVANIALYPLSGHQLTQAMVGSLQLVGMAILVLSLQSVSYSGFGDQVFWVGWFGFEFAA